jgi:hypothetical protein
MTMMTMNLSKKSLVIEKEKKREREFKSRILIVIIVISALGRQKDASYTRHLLSLCVIV